MLYLDGIAKYLDSYLRGQKISVGHFIATILVCGFTGYMSAHIMLLMNPNWAFIASGIGGYAGTNMMDFFVDVIKSKIGQSKDDK